MNVILISGQNDTGKTQSCFFIQKILQQKSFKQIYSSSNISSGNFFKAYTGFNKKQKQVNILINSESDLIGSGKRLQQYLQINKNTDIVITTIRDIENLRTNIENVLKPYCTSTDIIEIPLAKITRKIKFNDSYKWYKNAIENLLKFIIEHAPFDL